MGLFLIVISILKLLDWEGFQKAFAMYDIIAKRSRLYAALYPWIEFTLGIAFLYNMYIKEAAIVTLILMTIGIISVCRNLKAKNAVQCACLGTLIKVPLTKFTLIEDIIMAGMAIAMILG